VATWTQTAAFFAGVKRRSALALKASALHLQGLVKDALAEGGGGAGRRYDFYKGHLWPLDSSSFGAGSYGADGTVRFFTRNGKVIPMAEPIGGWKVRGRVHQASARGQAPRRLTGALSKTVSFRIGTNAAGDVIAQIGPSGPSVKYARWLEEEMKRPAWVPTMKTSWPELQSIYAETYARAG
jgi:hypothetical protein